MASCGCGSSTGNPEMCITQGGNYLRAVTYTENDSDGVQVILDAADWTAELVIKRGFDAATLLDLSSATDPELTLSTVDGSVVVNIDLGSVLTATLPVGKGYKYTLRIFLTADPDVAVILLNDEASVKATTFSLP